RFPAALEPPLGRFGRASGKRDAAAPDSDRALDPASTDFDRSIRLPPPPRPRVRIGEMLIDPWAHRHADFGRERRRRLISEIDHAARASARPRIRRHSSTKRERSRSLVCGPKLTRTTHSAISGATPMAARTRLCFMLPDEQALPAETEMPARSNWTSWLALGTPGMA